MITRYPNATWLPASPDNYRQAGRSTYFSVIIHCTDGRDDPFATARMWQEPDHGSSAHFVVGPLGQVIQAVDTADIAWHAHARNRTSVGIEHCARSPGELGANDPGLALTQAQYEASALLVKWLCQQANIVVSRDNILGHAEADLATTHTDCPLGAGWDWDLYMRLLTAP